MKFAIMHDLAPADVERHLPRPLVAALRRARAPDVPHTVLLFRLNQDPVRSAVVARALARVADPCGPLLAIGTGFTADSAALLEARGALVVAASDFFWTDASHERIRTLIASRVKAPDHQAR